jgi:aprataxin
MASSNPVNKIRQRLQSSKEHCNSPLSGTLASDRPTGHGKDDLLDYILAPEGNPRVVYHTDNWVLIKDLYPKSSVHLLLLPRNPVFFRQHPYRAFQDANFLEDARSEVTKAIEIAAAELRRLNGSYSVKEAPRIRAMELDDPPDELPEGRDWKRDVRVGIHGYPSMNHMHIHILSVDRYSPCLKHAKHYNTFNTKFFVPLDDFPLSTDDGRWVPEKLKEYTDGDLICWRCGRNFARKFKKLQEHLEMEYKEWRAQ